MERESNPMQAQCRSGCGFYGSPATDGLCSLCYKEALKKKQQPPNAGPTTTSSVTGSGFTTSSVGSYANANTTALVPTTATSNLIDTAVPTIPIISPPNNTTLSTSSSTPTDKNGELGPDGLVGVSCASTSVSSTPSEIGDDDTKDGDKDSGKKKKNRCVTCRKKVGLTGFECRCGGLFCSVHRYSDKHDCHFDYRLLGATEIRRNNPVVVGEKIKKI